MSLINAPKEQQIEYLQNTHVHLLLPCYGGMLTEGVFSSIVRFVILCKDAGIGFSLDTMVNESLVTRARNNLVAKAMHNNKATHIMFIDADIKFDPRAILQLLLHDKDVVGGAYPAKKEPPFYVLNRLPEDQEKHEGDLLSVYTLGTGFLCIKKPVMQKLFEAYPETKYIDSLNLGEQYEPYMYAIFDVGIDKNGRYLSEDWNFCVRWQDIGGEVWCDRNIELDHIGYHTFKGNIEKLKES